MRKPPENPPNASGGGNAADAFVMKVWGLATGQPFPYAGQFLEWFDPDIPDAADIMFRFTADLDKAKRYASAVELLDEWRRVRKPDPVRPDGKPNRPLTAFTVEVLRITP